MSLTEITLSEREVEVLLGLLCTRLGFCLPLQEQSKIGADPPRDVKAFTEAVFKAEGLDPDVAERRLWRQVRDVVAEAFRKHEDDLSSSRAQ